MRALVDIVFLGLSDMLADVCSIYREIKILRYLGHHPNIIRILHLQRPNDLTNFADL